MIWDFSNKRSEPCNDLGKKSTPGRRKSKDEHPGIKLGHQENKEKS